MLVKTSRRFNFTHELFVLEGKISLNIHKASLL